VSLELSGDRDYIPNSIDGTKQEQKMLIARFVPNREWVGPSGICRGYALKELMISVLIECKDQDKALAVTLAALVHGAVEGLVAEVVILDRGSRDGTAQLADAAGCRFLDNPDLRDVVRSARGDWLLLIEPGARPLLGWVDPVSYTHLTLPTTPYV